MKNYIFVADEIESNNLYTMVYSYKIIIHASFRVSCFAYMQGQFCLYSYFLPLSKLMTFSLYFLMIVYVLFLFLM